MQSNEIKERRKEDGNFSLLDLKIQTIVKKQVESEINYEKRFKYIDDNIKDGFQDLKELVNNLDAKVDQLWDEKNQREGAKENKKEVTDFSKFVAGGIGGLIAIVIGHFWK